MPFAATRTFPSAAPPCPDALEQLFEKLLRLPGEGAGVRQGRERGGVCFLGAPARSGRAAARGRRRGIELFRAVEVGRARLIDEGAQLGETLAQSEEHTSELQSPCNLVCRLLLEKKKMI